MTDEDATQTAEDLGGLIQRFAGRTALVTGATGMVGRAVTEALLAVADRTDPPLHVVALARSEAKARAVLPVDHPHLRLVVGGVVGGFPDEAVDFVVHAASPATPEFFRSDPVGVIDANVAGTRAALDLAREHGGHVSFVSTMEVYGRVSRAEGEEVVLTEADAGVVDSLDLRSAYPESKRLAETLCIAHAAQYGTRSDIVRLSHTYGPGMPLEDARVQAEFLRHALAGEQIVLKSDGSMTRTYTYIADAAAAIVRIMATAADRDEPAAFNVADEASRTSIADLARAVLTAAGRPADDLVFDIADASGQMWSKAPGGTFLDCSALRGLGWTARHQLADGLARTVRFHREQ